MADDEKAKSAKERLAAAKKAAEDAEVVADDASEKVAEAAKESADAAEEAVVETVDDLAKENETADDLATPEPSNEAGDDQSEVEPAAEADAEKPDEAFVDVASEDPPETPPIAPAPSKPRRPWSAVALQWIVLFLAGAVFALFAAPRVAPYLPAGVAELLSPRGDGLEEALAAANSENEAALAALTDRLDAAEAALSAQAEAAESARGEITASLEPRIAAAEAAKIDTSAFDAAVDEVAGRVTQAEAALEGLKAEVSGLAGFTGESAAPSAETLERVAAFGAAVEGLRAEVAALSEATAGIDRAASGADLAALADRVAALEGGQAATAGAEEEAQRIRGSARLDAALTRISRALIAGEPFAEQLGTAETISGVQAPAGLTAAAQTGAAPIENLARGFQDAAQDGYAAALADEAGDGMAERMLAAMQGRIGGRPSVETEGDDAGAVLSRIEARLRDGDAGAALAEAEGLSDAAADAMSGWLATLRKTAEARSAFGEYRAALATN